MSTMPLNNARDLAMLLHLNSEPWMNQQAYDEPAAPPPILTVEDAERFPLPTVSPTSVSELIRSRSSCRDFSGAPMPLEQLAALLHQSYGFLGLREVSGTVVHHRPVPSAGARFPLELYLLTSNVAGLANGAYHYAAWHHRLECIKPGVELADLLPNLQEQHYIVGANLMLFLTAVFPRTMTKYGPRGYRYILLEAGHVAQNICLLATELGLGSLCIGGFRESVFDELFRLTPPREGAVYAVAIGQPRTQL
jgi:SagB-type dehydrogenase family enzyme